LFQSFYSSIDSPVSITNPAPPLRYRSLFIVIVVTISPTAFPKVHIYIASVICGLEVIHELIIDKKIPVQKLAAQNCLSFSILFLLFIYTTSPRLAWQKGVLYA